MSGDDKKCSQEEEEEEEEEEVVSNVKRAGQFLTRWDQYTGGAGI